MLFQLNKLCVYQCVRYFSAKAPEFTKDLKIIDPDTAPNLVTYKVLNDNGTLFGNESYFAQVRKYIVRRFWAESNHFSPYYNVFYHTNVWLTKDLKISIPDIISKYYWQTNSQFIFSYFMIHREHGTKYIYTFSPVSTYPVFRSGDSRWSTYNSPPLYY